MTIPFWGIVTLLISLLSAAYAYVSSRRQDMTDLARRVDAVESTVARMPGTEDTHKLEMMMVEMSGDMKAMRATMRGMAESMQRTEAVVSRHEDHLREKH